MQLGNLTKGLSAATCALLGSTTAQAEESWQIDTAVMVYSETDRVSALEPSIYAKKTLEDDSIVNVFAVVDSLTGASPNGAAPSDEVQTFTSPSGRGGYQTQAGEVPLDDTFKDTRVQVGAGWDRPYSRTLRYNVGFNVSTEHDYVSAAVSAGIVKSFNNKNTELSVGGAFAHDTIFPEGDKPVPLSFLIQSSSSSVQTREKDDSKQVVDLMVGVTQVINQRTIMQFNVGLSNSEGYHNDPYKFVSWLDINGRPTNYIYENRPDSRSKQYLFWRTQWYSNWQPRVRLYQQSAANFYRHSLGLFDPLPKYLSSDQRLGEFDALTLGIKVGYQLSTDERISVRLQSYKQTGESNPSDAIGVQQDLNLFKGVEAFIAQVSYSFTW